VIEVIGIVGSIASIIGIPLAIIGIKCLAKANKLTAKFICDSSINQAETITIHNHGADTFAIIKIARDTTKEELDSILPRLFESIQNVTEQVARMPRTYTGTGPPTEDLMKEMRDGDFYLQYDEKNPLIPNLQSEEATHNG
jgi:hypothetical protein